MLAGLVAITHSSQPRRGVPEQIRDPRSGRAVDVVKGTIADQALLNRAEGGTRALRASILPKRERGGVIGRRGERVPARIDRGIHKGRAMLCSLADVQRVVMLVGVLRSSERLDIVAPKRRVHPTDHVTYDAVVPGCRERAMRLGVDRQKLGVVLEHLLVVRDLPLPRGRVAEESALAE